MAINDKLNRIKEIKEDIKQALIDKGVEVTDEDSFGSYADKITNIPQEGGGNPYYEDLYNMRTSNGTNMSGLFAYAKGDSLDLTGLDVSKCTSMYYMFSDCDIKNVDITGWDTGNVQDISYMFEGSTISNINGLSELKFPNVTKYENIFYTGKMKYIDLSGWDINNVTRLSYFVAFGSTEKIDLTNWNTRNITYMSNVFYSLSNLTDLIIPDWDMTNVTSSNNFIGSTNNLRYIDLSRSNDLTINKIISFIPTKTEAAYGEMKIPADSSQEVIDALISKYWKPIGPALIPTSFEIASELDEVLLNKSTKVHFGNINPWYCSTGEIEFISSDETIASINEQGEVTTHALGNVEIYARLKNNPNVVSNTISISISETDSTPYVIKFRGTKTPTNNNYMKINGANVSLTDMQYNSITGIYTYDVGSEITSINFIGNTSYGKDTITELLKFDFNRNNIVNMSKMFDYCTEITDFNFLSDWDVSSVVNMDYLFNNTNLRNVSSIEKWDVGNVTKMGSMFSGSSITNIDLSKWTINASSISNLFNGCRHLKTAKLPKLVGKIAVSLFSDCISLESVDMSNVNNIGSGTGLWQTSFKNVPSTCKVYINEQTWNPVITEAVCGFTGTFIRLNFTPEYYTEYSIDSSTATFNMRPIDSINSGAYLPELSNGYDAVLLTLNDGSITTDLDTEANQVSSIKIYYPEETSYVKFANTKVKEVNHLSGSNITDCTGMFTNCIYLEKADLTGLPSTVRVDSTMFAGSNCDADITFSEDWSYTNAEIGREEPKYIVYTIDSAEGGTLSSGKYLPTLNGTYSLEITKTDGTTTDDIETNAVDVTNIRCIFGDDIDNIDFSYTNIKDVTYISIPSSVYYMHFNECSKLEYFNGENLDTTNLDSLYMLFYNCGALKTIDGVSDWKVSNVTSFYTMFRKCSSLTSLDLSSWDVSNATEMDSMSGMFSGCTSLQNLNVSNWEVNVHELIDIFTGCSSLTSLDLSTWKVNNLTSLSWTFARCSSLTSLDLSTWDVSSVTSMGYTFGECSSLQTLNLSTWNTRNVTETYSVFEGIPSSVDWCYDGTNYSNFSLTEEQTGFNGTFPWTSSQPEEPTSHTLKLTIHYNREDYTGDWRVVCWGNSFPEDHLQAENMDGYGLYYSKTFTYSEGDNDFRFIIYKNVDGLLWNENTDAGEKYLDYSQLLWVSDSSGNRQAHIYVKENDDTIYYTQPGQYITGFSLGQYTVGFTYGQQTREIPMYFNPGEEELPTNFIYSYNSNNSYSAEFILTPDGRFMRITLIEKMENALDIITVTETNSGISRTLDCQVYDDEPQPEEPDTPDEDGLVEMVFHINDFKNAFNSLTVITSYDPYVYAEYDLENAPTDDYGKFITIKVTPNANNDINLSSNCGYDSIGVGIDTTNYSEIWFDTMNNNLYTTPTRPNTITSLEGTFKLKINYYPHDLDISNGDYIRLDEGNYKRWINYKSSENNWYVYEEDVIANHVINFDAYGFYGEIPALTEDTEVWLMSHNNDIYTTKPEVPNFTSFNTRVHLQKQGSDYSEGWHLCLYTGNNSNTYDIPQENVDEFGLYFDIPELLYTNIRHGFQFYNDAGDWLSTFDSRFTETHSELWMIDGDSTIYTEKPSLDDEGTPEEPNTPEGGEEIIEGE